MFFFVQAHMKIVIIETSSEYKDENRAIKQHEMISIYRHAPFDTCTSMKIVLIIHYMKKEI